MVQVIPFTFFVVIAMENFANGQVCSPIGKQCFRTTDCCQGCCEAFSCVDRPFSCSTDMIAQPGSQACIYYRCPPDHLCFLREVCPPENPCPRQPSCRRVSYDAANFTSYRYNRNGSSSWSIGSLLVLIVTSALVFIL